MKKYQNLDALLRLVSAHYNTDTKRCNFTIQDDNLILAIWYKDQWHSYKLDDADYHLLPDTLFQEIAKHLNSLP